MLSTRQESSLFVPLLEEKKDGWTILLLLAAVVATLGSCVPAGYNIGVVNAPAQIIKQFCNETVFERYNIALSPFSLDILWSSIVSIFIIGGVIGSLTASSTADRWGRKGSIIITDVLGLAGGVCFVLSRQVSSVELLLIGRFVVGLAAGLTTTVVPMYLTELAPLKIRGATGVMCQLGITIGVLLGQIVGLEHALGKESTWHYLLAFYTLLILLTATTLPILPESPKYLSAIKHQEERAIKELIRIRASKEEHLREEIEALRNEMRGEEQDKKYTSCLVLKDPQLRLPLLLVCALQSGQQFSGINAVFYYSLVIFESSGLTPEAAQYANLGAGVANLLIGIVSIYTINRFGRRPLVLISCVGSALCLCLLTVAITFNDAVDWLHYVSTAAVLLYVLFYGIGLGPIPYFIGSELFEVGPRPIAMAWGSMFNWGGNFCVGMTFTSFNSLIGQYSFLIFIGIIICLTAFLALYFPETKDRDQSEIAELLKLGFKSDIKRHISKGEVNEDMESSQLTNLQEGKTKNEEN